MIPFIYLADILSFLIAWTLISIAWTVAHQDKKQHPLIQWTIGLPAYIILTAFVYINKLTYDTRK